MNRGQADIDSSPGGTTFCLSGTHNWSLRPKRGDRFIGPAVLDGGNSTKYAFDAGSASNVDVTSLEIRNYTAANQQGAIYVWNKSGASGWVLRSLSVHDNGTRGGGGVGVNLGSGWQVFGGRYWNNRQEGIGGSGPNSIVDGAEIDHNNFTDDGYSTRNIDCAFEAGGFKWVADNVTVRNSRVHDNACKGVWIDMNSQGGLIANNQVYDNWDEGIFVEISAGTTITGNTVWGNGFRTVGGNGHSCPWLWGGGITLASSGGVNVADNTVTGNCNGITATQQNRPQGHPGLLQNVSIHDNTIGGPGGRTGAVEDTGANLATRNIGFANNHLTNGMTLCALTC
jgi:parallel beta-helix repeat protein